MKTLDETIFEAPYTMTSWEENAIYYLKEYRDHMKNEIIELQEEVKKQKEMIEFLEKPLTWDELKQMEGKPIWVEDDLETPEDTTKYWAILQRIEKVESDEYALLSDFYYEKSQYGKDWVAYRKERE